MAQLKTFDLSGNVTHKIKVSFIFANSFQLPATPTTALQLVFLPLSIHQHNMLHPLA